MADAFFKKADDPYSNKSPEEVNTYYKAGNRMSGLASKLKDEITTFCNFMERHQTTNFIRNTSNASQSHYNVAHHEDPAMSDTQVHKGIHKGLLKAPDSEGNVRPTVKGNMKWLRGGQRAKTSMADFKLDDVDESKAHPGFKAVQNKVAKNYGKEAAGAIVAAASRNASKKAKAKNPKLRKVKG